MVDFNKSDKLIKISGKVDKPSLTTDPAILIFPFYWKKNEISKLLNPLSESVYPLFLLLLSHTHTHTHTHIYIYMRVTGTYPTIPPKMDSSNLQGETTSRSLRDIWQTDCKPSTASTSFVWIPFSANTMTFTYHTLFELFFHQSYLKTTTIWLEEKFNRPSFGYNKFISLGHSICGGYLKGLVPNMEWSFRPIIWIWFV